MLGMVPTDALFNDPGRNKEPDPNAEYIYDSSMVWSVAERANGSLRSDGEVKVTPGRIAIKVRKNEYERIFFEFKDEPGVLYTTNYGWSFILNTPENVVLFQEWKARNAQIAQLEKLNRKLFKHMTTLDNTR